MKSRWSQLFDKSLAAMVASIEIYNKPDFKYREETFSVLAINSWELLLKAFWLKKNKNKIGSLYVYENKTNKDGTKSKKKTIKHTRSGNPFTHSIDYLIEQLISDGTLPSEVKINLDAMIEIRDSSIHFYNKSPLFSKRLQEVGMGALKNYVTLVKEWFDIELTEYNFYLMPLSFVSVPPNVDGLVLNKEEKNLINFINNADTASEVGDYSVTVNVNVNFVRSKAKEAFKVKVVKEDGATKIKLTEEQIREKYPWDYSELYDRCKGRYKDFKCNKEFHDLRKSVLDNEAYCMTRYLDPGNQKSSKKIFFNPNILKFFDERYERA